MRFASLITPDVKALLREDPDQVHALLEEIHPEDLADMVAELEPEEQSQLLQRLHPDDAAAIFERLEEHEQEDVVEHLSPQSIASIASEMEPDDVADLITNLPDDVGERVLEQLEEVDPEAAEDVREIQQWPETSAGHLMTTNYVGVAPSGTVAETIEAVRSYARDNDAPVYNVYAMEEGERVVGTVSLRELLLSKPDEPLTDVLRTHVISVPPDLDQEDVARQMARYDLNVMPVVDAEGALLGVITIDDVVDVLTQEQTEDVQKIGGVEPLEEPYFQTGFGEFLRKRGLTLIILFLGEFFTQTALRHYDPVFRAIEGASYYVPLLISAGGNSGSQSSTLVIRGMAVGEIRGRDWIRVFYREASIGLGLGAILGFIGYGRVVAFGSESHGFAITIGLTLVGIVLTGCTVGSMLPIVLRRFGFDPATSSTPFIASLVDVAGIVVFVQIAKIVMAEVIAAHAESLPGGVSP